MSSGLYVVVGILMGVGLTSLFFARVLARRQPAPAADVSEETLAKARELVARGKPVRAVKVVREDTGWGLKQAKAVVDDLSRPQG